MFLFETFPFTTFLVVIGFLASLVLLNEIVRFNKWISIAMFTIVPLFLTIFVWRKTAVAGTGAGTWFQWAKTYSVIIGCIGGMAIRYIPKLSKNKIALCFPPFILAVNILEAVIRDFQLVSANGLVDGYMTIGGPWNIMNGIAGILNILTICGWFGIVITKDKKKDLIWPDMMWFWIIAYDFWNLAYVYNSVSDRAMYSGVVLLLACTIPAFFIKKGAWALHRVQTLAFMMMFTLSVPAFFTDERFLVKATQSQAAYYTLSIIALAANVAVAGYQLYTIIKRKKNPLKDELYSHTKEYKKILDAELIKNAAVVVSKATESEKEKDKTLVL
jgi:hypothetical protein